MKKALLLLLLYSAFRNPQSALAQEPDCFRIFTAMAATRALTFENRLHGCTQWTLAYTSTGFTALNIQIERAADSSGSPGTWTVWTAGSVIEGGPFPLSSTTGAAATVKDFWPWTSVNITSITGSGTISGALIGRRVAPALLMSALAVADGAALSAVSAAGDRAQAKSDFEGRVLVRTDHPNRFSVGFNSIAATLTEIKAAPAAGNSIYITDFYIQTTTATSGTYALQSGTGTNCGTGTTAVFPVTGAANRFNAPVAGNQAIFQFLTPLKLTAANALCVIGVATNTVSGQVNGYVASAN